LTELSALNIKYSIEDRQTIPKFLDELGKNESENLLTVGFGLHLLQRVQVINNNTYVCGLMY